jgi:hypothetical protein
MVHRTEVARYPGTLAELVEEAGNLRYDALAELLRLLQTKLERDASQDERRGRARLAAALRAAASPLADAARGIQEAWRICEPHMVGEGK